MGKDKQSKTDFCSVVYFQKSVNKKAEITLRQETRQMLT